MLPGETSGKQELLDLGLDAFLDKCPSGSHRQSGLRRSPAGSADRPPGAGHRGQCRRLLSLAS
jgi:hypothetical protein